MYCRCIFIMQSDKPNSNPKEKGIDVCRVYGVSRLGNNLLIKYEIPERHAIWM